MTNVQTIFESQNKCGVDCTPIGVGKNYTIWVKKDPVRINEGFEKLPIVMLESLPEKDTDDMAFGDITKSQFDEIFLQIYESVPYDFYDPKHPNKELEEYFDNHPEDSRLRDATLSLDAFSKKTEEELFDNMRELFRSVSVGDMENISLDMIEEFGKTRCGSNNPRKPYKNMRLNSLIKYHEVSNNFIEKLEKSITIALESSKYNLNTALQVLKKEPPSLWFDFSSWAGHIDNDPRKLLPVINYGSLWGGLGITIHDTMGFKVELIGSKTTRKNIILEIKVTIYDYFGLDQTDVNIEAPLPERHQQDGSATMEGMVAFKKWAPLMIDRHIGANGFISWYYLQHVRCYNPMVTTVENIYEIEINL